MPTSAPSAAARRRDGFVERGDKVTRLETFVDAAFAFAVSLLVISAGSIPTSIDELLLAFKRVPSFAAAFAILALFWSAHNRWSRRYGLDEGPSNLLALVLVFLVLVFVYPLRMVFESFFAWITVGWLPLSFKLDSMADLRAMFVTYGICFGTLSLVLWLLYIRAWQKRAAIGLDHHEQAATASHRSVYAFFVLLGVTSIAVAVLQPEPTATWQFGLAGNVYFLMFATWPISALSYRAVQKRLAAA